MNYVTPADCNNLLWTLISGDPSSDHYAASLAASLRVINPQAEIFGIGGPKLRMLSNKIQDYAPLCVLGLFEVLKHIPRILLLKRHLLSELEQQPPHTVVLFDCPGFNMHLLPRIPKKHRIIYVIPPQIWAWHERRIKKLQRYCSELWVLYPFEVEFYARHGVTVHLLKHPLIEKKHLESRPLLDMSPRPKVALLPGSRRTEHERLMPYYIQLSSSMPEIDWIWVEHASGALSDWYGSMSGTRIVGLEQLPPIHCAVAASGTVTLELAFMRIPSLVVYRVSSATAWIARHLITTRYIALANILLNTPVYPELIQDALTQTALRAQLRLLLTDEERRRQYQLLSEVRRMFSLPASDMAELAHILSKKPLPSTQNPSGGTQNSV